MADRLAIAQWLPTAGGTGIADESNPVKQPKRNCAASAVATLRLSQPLGNQAFIAFKPNAKDAASVTNSSRRRSRRRIGRRNRSVANAVLKNATRYALSIKGITLV